VTPREASGFAIADPFVPAFRAESQSECVERLLVCVHAFGVGPPIDVGPLSATCRIFTLEQWLIGFPIAEIASRIPGRSGLYVCAIGFGIKFALHGENPIMLNRETDSGKLAASRARQVPPGP
jgi:hypothetical protein